jgi:membrane peptidoglycan carboxypeptidase
MRRLLTAGIVALALIALTAGAVYGSLPGVGDAPARVAAIVHSHGGGLAHVSPQARVARATVAIEDRRYWEHGAIDPVAVGRVLFDSVFHPGVDPGGSTIAQQLAKVLYDEPATALGRLKAIGLAFKLEQHYSKARILGMYLNSIYYGHGFWGVGSASRGYFGRSINRLSWSQAALLAGLPQAPSVLDPFRHPQAARDRREAVLDELAANGTLPSNRAEAVAAGPLALTIRAHN